MSPLNLIGMIDATFAYFQSLGSWQKDAVGVTSVREVRSRMVKDLETFSGTPSKSDLQELCRQWRALRIESNGPPSYPPDMFIESVCQVIEIS